MRGGPPQRICVWTWRFRELFGSYKELDEFKQECSVPPCLTNTCFAPNKTTLSRNANWQLSPLTAPAPVFTVKRSVGEHSGCATEAIILNIDDSFLSNMVSCSTLWVVDHHDNPADKRMWNDIHLGGHRAAGTKTAHQREQRFPISLHRAQSPKPNHRRPRMSFTVVPAAFAS